MDRYAAHRIVWRRQSEPATTEREVTYWTALHERDAAAVRAWHAADPQALVDARAAYTLACEAGDVVFVSGQVDTHPDLPVSPTLL